MDYIDLCRKYPRKMKKEFSKIEAVIIRGGRWVVLLNTSKVTKWTRKLMNHLINVCNKQAAEEMIGTAMQEQWKQDRLDSLLEGGV